VFHSVRDGDLEIYAMDPDGLNVVKLTDNNDDDLWPAISPDGRTIAFYTDRDVNLEIYTINADGSSPMRVTNSGVPDRFPAWSPDGTRIVFSRVVSGTHEIYTIRPDGTGLTRLTNNSFEDQDPAWSPDGLKIAFTTNRDGDYEVYTMNALDGTAPTNLTNSPGRESRPDWSPDGSKILFDRNDSAVDAGWLGSAEIMCMGSDGSGVIRMTTDASSIVDFQPRWSPDGTRLVFVTDRDGIGVNNELYVGDTNGCVSPISGLNRVTVSADKDEAGDWSP
jgi:tol-pal system beta propeller repeat protein TolB